MIITSNKKALTLTELLVASILIGIVMVGIVTFSEAIRQFQETSRSGSVLNGQLETAMAFLINDGMKTIGDASSTGSASAGCGIRADNSLAAQGYICFRQGGDATPGIYSDDPWVCFIRTRVSGRHRLTRCPTNDPYANLCPDATQEKFLTFLSVTTGTIPNWFTVHTLPGGVSCSIDRIDFNLQTRPNVDQGINPIINPEFSLRATISPPGHSR